jgi:hypothetical protein
MDREETSETQLPTNDDKFWSFPAVIQEKVINLKNWFSNAGNQSPSIRFASSQLLPHREQSVAVRVCGLFRAFRIPELIAEPRIFDSYRRSDVIHFVLCRVTPLSELVCRITAWMPKWLIYLPHAATRYSISCPLASRQLTCMMYNWCCVYSLELLMMDGKIVRNM